MSGTYRVFRLGRDERDVTLLGPFFSEAGVRGGTRWQQTRNGITYTYNGVHENRDARSESAWLTDNEPREVRLIGESVPLNAYVVEIDPPGGRHEWRFIDKSTANMTRREYVEKGRRFTVTFDDYRTFDGIAEPSHVRTVDSYGNERDLSLLSRTLDLTPDPHDVEIPPSRRTLVDFPPGVTNVHLPMRVVNGLCVVKVRIGREGLRLLARLGRRRDRHRSVDRRRRAPRTLRHAHRRDDRHVHRNDGHRAADDDRRVTHALRRRARRFRSVSPRRAHAHRRALGLRLLPRYRRARRPRPRHRRARSHRRTFKAPADAATIPIALDDRTPVVRARADGVTGRVVLDTGANRSVFTTPFASRADIAFDPSTAVALFRALGGTGTAETVRLKSFDIAALPLLDPVVDVSNANLGAEDIDGTAGTDLLHAYDLFFDYRAGALYVRRSRKSLN